MGTLAIAFGFLAFVGLIVSVYVEDRLRSAKEAGRKQQWVRYYVISAVATVICFIVAIIVAWIAFTDPGVSLTLGHVLLFLFVVLVFSAAMAEPVSSSATEQE